MRRAAPCHNNAHAHAHARMHMPRLYTNVCLRLTAQLKISTNDFEDELKKAVKLAWEGSWEERFPGDNDNEQSISALEDELKEFGNSERDRIRNDVDPDHEEAEPLLVGFIGSTNHEFSWSAERTQDQGAFAREVLMEVGKQLAHLKMKKRVAGIEEHKVQRVVTVSGGFRGVGQGCMESFAAECKEINRTGTTAYAVLPDAGFKELGEQLFEFAGRVAPLEIGGDIVWTPSSATFEKDNEFLMKKEDQQADMKNQKARYVFIEQGKEEKIIEKHGEDWREKARFGKWHDSNPLIGSIVVGKDVKERERYLALTTPVLIMVEGGPGARNEAMIAMINRRLVIPIGCVDAPRIHTPT